MARGSPQDEQVGEHVDDVNRLEPAADPDGQALPGVFVDHIKHAELSAIVGSALDEVAGPAMVGVLGPQPDTGSVIDGVERPSETTSKVHIMVVQTATL
jgi:hypothetical protein